MRTTKRTLYLNWEQSLLFLKLQMRIRKTFDQKIIVKMQVLPKKKSIAKKKSKGVEKGKYIPVSIYRVPELYSALIIQNL